MIISFRAFRNWTLEPVIIISSPIGDNLFVSLKKAVGGNIGVFLNVSLNSVTKIFVITIKEFEPATLV